MTETISVIISVFDGAKYLRECLSSVLDQTLPPDEVIVVDDGSRDGSASIACSFGAPVRVLQQANAGQAAGLVAGMKVATGTQFAFNDADDLWTPRKLEIQRALLEEDAQLEAVFGLTEQFVSPELGEDEQRRFAPPVAIMPGRLLQASLIRRRVFDRIGGIDPTLRGAGAADWIARAQGAGLSATMLSEIVHRRRLHAANYGRTHVAERDKHLLSALRSQIIRQRATSGKP